MRIVGGVSVGCSGRLCSSPPINQESVRIVAFALKVARRHLADYAHVFSPKKFTQPQLFACLILKAHLGCTYRKCEELLILMPAVREAIGLNDVPRFTTLQTFVSVPRTAPLTPRGAVHPGVSTHP